MEIKKMARKKGKSPGTRYRKTVTIGHDMHGDPIRKDFYAGSKHELNQKIENFKISQATGGVMADKNATFSQWAWQWIDIYKKDRVEKNSIRANKTAVRSLCAYFGNAPLSAIREVDIMGYFNSKSNLKKSSLEMQYTVLHQIFKTAVSNDLLISDPMADIPKPAGQKSAPRRAYTLDQYRFVVDFAKHHPDGLGPFVMLKSGVRIAELCGLKWGDFDFDAGLLSIRRTWTDEDGVKSYGKTVSSLRVIPLDTEAINYLKMQSQDGDNFVIGLLPDRFRKKVFKNFQNDLLELQPDFPRLTPHEMRHTYGTMLYQAGTDLLTISRVMGHASVSTTQKIYVHDTVDDLIKNIKFPD